MNFDHYTIKSQEALQKAINLSKANQHQIIQTGHLLKAVLMQDETVTSFLLNKLNIYRAPFEKQLDDIINAYGKLNTQQSYSNDSHKALQKSEEYMQKMKDQFVTTEHLLLGLLEGNDNISRLMKEVGFKAETLQTAIAELRGGKTVDDQNAENKYRSLERYSINLNELARQGKLDPIIGRDEEIRRVLQIISRRTKNNPMLVGTPGVGKTALVEGLAQRIVSGDIPENLKGVEVISLDMGLLVAGAKYKGEFEERLKSVIKEVKESDGQIVLFIDEIHTLIGAGGGGESAMDAANLLKPALARGELRSIGATTLKEYQKYIEKDKALERRFQTILVDEPTVPDAISILRGIKEKYEVHHGVRIKDDAIISAVELSHRYISDRQLPDKAIDLMDEAAARMRVQIDSMPEELDEIQRKVMQLEIEREAIRRENDKEKETVLSKELAELNDRKKGLMAKWKSEKEIIVNIQKTKELIDQSKVDAEKAEREGDYGKVAELRYGVVKTAEERLTKLQAEWAEKIGESAMLKEEVTSEDIADIVSKWTGIPVSKMLQSEREKLLRLEEELGKRVAGQAEAIQAVSDAVRRSRAGLQDPKKPIGSFLFLGTTGVGKTELAKSLAAFLFNDEQAMVRIDMSEYQEKHTVSRLIGAPPGYVGYDEGGQLTEAVRKRPYSVVLLDEIEKAHPDVFNVMLQVLDDGRLTDNKGRVVNFKNTIIIMTSNMGSQLIMENFRNMTEENSEAIIEKTRLQVFELLKQSVRPEFLNRIDELIMFQPLGRKEIRKIVEIQFRHIQEILRGNGVEIIPIKSTEVFDYLGGKGFDPQFGARPLKRILQRELLNELSKEMLKGTVSKDAVVGIELVNGELQFQNMDEVTID